MFKNLRRKTSQPEAAAPRAQVAQTVRRSPIATVLGPGASINGILHVPHGARIDGDFEGELQIAGPLVIGEHAMIKAHIHAEAVSVAGTVKGNITAEKIDILSTGRVYGDLLTNSISTEEGGFLRGTVQMTDTQNPQEVGTTPVPVQHPPPEPEE